ncbi:MAG: hypothetical protein LBV72_04305 [Tannerella sp.]|jgi:hypothetical protein|nr:hypothetical protein [Tannerella sp.]
MERMTLNETIANLSSLYEELNNRWLNDTCSVSVYQVSRQKEYRDSYEKLKSTNIESLALRVITDSVNETVLGRLRNLIAENIRIYETRQDDFNQFDFDKLYPLWERYLFDNKRELLLKDKETIKDYHYPTEQERKLLLEENQFDLNQLDNDRNELYRTESLCIRQNYYSLISDISCSFGKILDSYFPIEKEKTPKEIKPVINPGLYFDMKRVSAIHHECNNIQFENLTEVDFYAILNLQPTNAKLSIKSGEKTRMSFLIHKLYEYLKTDNKKEWRTAILEVAGIDEKYYNSKYKEPESEISSRKSESFAQRINRIFE